MLRIGFPGNYAGRELYQTVNAFAQQCPQTVVQVTIGTHEELYDLLRFEGADLVVNDQRRAFSEAYVNLHLAYRTTLAEVCATGGLAEKGALSLAEALSCLCVLITSPGQEEHERDYYHTTLGFGSRFLSSPTWTPLGCWYPPIGGFYLLRGYPPGKVRMERFTVCPSYKTANPCAAGTRPSGGKTTSTPVCLSLQNC